MDDETQLQVPRSFVELCLREGSGKPCASRAHIELRHEFCEDLAQLLSGRARELRADLGITDEDVLERMHQGLLQADSGLDAREAWWVRMRLRELLEHFPRG